MSQQTGQDIICKECRKELAGDTAIPFGEGWLCVSCKPAYVEKLMAGRDERHRWLWLCLFFFMGLMQWIIYTAPKFSKVYAEMLAGEPLSAFTIFFCGVPSLIYFVFTLFFVGGSCAFHYSTRSLDVRRNLRVAIIMITILLFAIYIIAVFRPLIRTGTLRELEGPLTGGTSSS